MPVPDSYARKSANKQTTAQKKQSSQKESKTSSKKEKNNSKNNSKSSGKSTNKNSSQKSSNKTASSGKGKSKPKSKETSADVRKKQEEAQKEITLTRQQIKENDVAVKKNLAELGKLEGDIAEGKKNVAQVEAKVTALQNQISKLQTQIVADEKKLEKLRTEYLKVVKKMRGKKKGQSNLAFIFSSGSFNQAMRRMRYLKEVSEWRDKQTTEISKHVESLKVETDRLARTKQMHDKALAESVQAQKSLQTQYVRQDALVAELKKNGEALRSHLVKKQEEVNVLKGRISALIAEEQRKAEAERAARQKAEAERKAKEEARARALAEAKAKEEADAKAKESKAKQQSAEKAKAKNNKNEAIAKTEPKKNNDIKSDNKSSNKSGTTYAEARSRKPRSNNNNNSSAGTAPSNTAPVSTSGFASMKGSLPRPVSGSFRVTSRFGRNSLPDMPDVVFDNPGIDAEVASGATAVAVYEGKVSGVYLLPGYSTVVIINHDGYYTVYGNIASASVKVGDSVKQGQSLGRLAPDEDDSSHSVIHFEVWKNRDKQDPLGWIR